MARIRHNDPMFVPQADVDRAKRWDIGTEVTVTKDHGEEVQTRTRSAPWQTGDGTWIILVEGISGGYALARIKEGWR